ncbi:unnamed protein product [Echinostoma caproni]|uniref:Integrase catalytic domain-containing protein n=1 Tax=Echinostoma caproni TaxID=27848 RepID=A0A183AWC1_9TREM|nr:unnamed protein product [Echinostoma caproni]
MAWQRFVGKRDNPSSVFSDNGPNFVGAQKELSNWLMRLDKCALQDRLSPSGTQWHFNPPMVDAVRQTSPARPTVATWNPMALQPTLQQSPTEELGNGLYGRCEKY